MQYKYLYQEDWPPHLQKLGDQFVGCLWVDCSLELLYVCCETKSFMSNAQTRQYILQAILQHAPVYKLLHEKI